jgi:DNA-binding HxlR family transcriptional regulator
MKDIISKINKVFENKVRLGIMSALMVNKKLDFNHLKKLMDVTDGNLSSNISVLEELGYVEVTKTFIGKKTNTSFNITGTGRSSFMEHLDALEDLISRSKG